MCLESYTRTSGGGGVFVLFCWQWWSCLSAIGLSGCIGGITLLMQYVSVGFNLSWMRSCGETQAKGSAELLDSHSFARYSRQKRPSRVFIVHEQQRVMLGCITLATDYSKRPLSA